MPGSPPTVHLRSSVSTSPPPNSELFSCIFLLHLHSPGMRHRVNPAWTTSTLWPPGNWKSRRLPLRWQLGYRLKMGVAESETAKWHLIATILDGQHGLEAMCSVWDFHSGEKVTALNFINLNFTCATKTQHKHRGYEHERMPCESWVYIFRNRIMRSEFIFLGLFAYLILRNLCISEAMFKNIKIVIPLKQFINWYAWARR